LARAHRPVLGVCDLRDPLVDIHLGCELQSVPSQRYDFCPLSGRNSEHTPTVPPLM
jgi:hypothetical protein